MIERIQIYAWDGVEMLRGISDALRWPFERIAWAFERGLIWPLEERTGNWSSAVRVSGIAVLALAAIGAGALGLHSASNDGTAGEVTTATPAVASPVAAQPSKEAAPPAEPVLQGATPDFRPELDGGASKAAGAAAIPAQAAGSETPTTASSSAAAKAEPAGPAAVSVARQFAGAFVLFETGKDNGEVRTAFAETATPQLARSLLQRPPRLPANAEVPKAKVLNIVPGPRQGEAYTLSVSLLRLGVTSELRVTMQRDKASGEWQVTDVLG
jgi:hypothetical protein